MNEVTAWADATSLEASLLKRQKITSNVLVSDTHELVREHTLDGIHILPGVAMLDVIYKTLASAGHLSNRLKLQNILFHEPVVTRSSIDRSLTVTIEIDTHAGQVRIHSLPVRNGEASTNLNEKTLHLSCQITHCEPLTANLVSTTMQDDDDLDTCYEVTRHVGIHHDDFMKCLGRVHSLPKGGCMARVSLGDRARKRQKDFQLHPVLLDCSTVVPMYGWHTHLDDAQLFIPFGIEEFQATSLQGHSEVYIQVEPSLSASENSELIRNSFTLFSLSGEPLVRFKHFAVKRVRSLENVRHLLNSGMSARQRKSPLAQQTQLLQEPNTRTALQQFLYSLINPHVAQPMTPQNDALSFFELGLDSIIILDLVESLETRLNVKLYPTLLFEHSTVAGLTKYLSETYPAEVALLNDGHFDAAQATNTSVVTVANLTQDVTELHKPELQQLVIRHIEQSASVSLDLLRDQSTPFFELGINSIALLDACESLGRDLGIELYPTLLFEHQTVAALSEWLLEAHPKALVGFSDNQRSLATSNLTENPLAANTFTQDSLLPADNTQIYLPRWLPVTKHSASVESVAASKAILITTIGSSSTAQNLSLTLAEQFHFDQAIKLDNNRSENNTQLEKALCGEHSFDQLWCINISHLDLFALLRLLIAVDRLSTPLEIILLTENAFSVHADRQSSKSDLGAWGLLQTASREYPQLSVKLLDLPGNDEAVNLDTAPLACETTLQLLALRNGRYYKRYLLPARQLDKPVSAWRENGIYLIVGGSGGIGLSLLKRLCERHNARVAIMGRRALSELPDVQGVMSRFGERVSYNQGNADSKRDLLSVFEQVKRNFGGLHGVVHAAMVLDDKRLVDMPPRDFERVLTPKVAGIDALTDAVAAIELDFLLIFSSLQSFVGNVAQGNYAAASAYLDARALAFGQSNKQVPVRVINWGVWGEVGAVATDVHRKLLSRQGIAGMTTERALDELDHALSAGWEQCVIADLTPAVVNELGGLYNNELLTRSLANDQTIPQSVQINWDAKAWSVAQKSFTDTHNAMEKMMALARARMVCLLEELYLSDPDALKSSPGIVKEFHPLLNAIMDWLALENSKESLNQIEFESALSDLCQKVPHLLSFAGLLRHCMAAYPLIFSGEKRASEVVFPQGSTDLVKAVYADNAVSTFYNTLVANQVVRHAAELKRCVRVLEIGAGTGATTQAVLEAMQEQGLIVEYHYTELWDKLLLETKARLSPQYSNLSFHFLDINNNPLAQGLPENYDVVIATNVLHATHTLSNSLQHVKALLAKGGQLILNESVSVQPYSTLTFGLLPGWWQLNDTEERLPNSPLVSRKVWCELLKDAGFTDVATVVPVDEQSGLLNSQEVFVGVSNGESRVGRTVEKIVSLSDEPIGKQTVEHKTDSSATKSSTTESFLTDLTPLQPEDIGLVSIESLLNLKLYRDTQGHLWLFMDNPPANTFTEQGLAELCQVLECIKSQPDKHTRRLLYISHQGPYFSVGGDRIQIANWVNHKNWSALRGFAENARRLLVSLATIDAIVVGVVNGSAQGGGLETLLATDLQIVRPDVGLSLPEIKSGLLPGMGGMTHLKQQLGMAPLKRMLLSGNQLSAEQAHDMGLISHLADNPFEAALALSDQLDHLHTAVLIKQRLNEDLARTLTADIDYWLNYLSTKGDLIDLNRIENSEQVLMHQLMNKPDYAT